MARSKPNKKSEQTKFNAELTEAEWIIMRVVWENESCAAGTVQEALADSKDWAYSTVKTTMDRMANKGFLKIQKFRNLQLFSSAISEVHAKRGEFRKMLKRDIREVWSGILASLFCVYIGIQLNFWVIFVMVPFGIYISLVLVIDRKIQKGKQVKPSKSLDSYVQASLSQLDHQIWLVKNVFLWYLLPLSLSFVCLVSGALWEAARSGCTVLWVWAFLGGLPVFFAFVIIAVYRVNQKGVREELLPRRQELEQLLTSIQNSDE